MVGDHSSSKTMNLIKDLQKYYPKLHRERFLLSRCNQFIRQLNFWVPQSTLTAGEIDTTWFNSVRKVSVKPASKPVAVPASQKPTRAANRESQESQPSFQYVGQPERWP